MKNTGTYMSVLVVTLAVLAFAAVRVSAHEGNSTSDVIHACASNKGVVRIVGVSGSCSTSETAVHWADLSRVAAIESAAATLQSMVAALQGTVATLQGTVATLQASLAHITVFNGQIDGLSGPHVIIEGANLHLRSGSGVTNDATNLGNLIVGYNEPPSGPDTSQRTGSHNIVVGHQHKFTGSGGLVIGTNNRIFGDYASVTGGSGNEASGDGSSVSGGFGNTASGSLSSVSGGSGNLANGFFGASVSGGQGNTASGGWATVGGGDSRTAPGNYDWVAGTLFQDF